jgi:hypothetical protein
MDAGSIPASSTLAAVALAKAAFNLPYSAFNFKVIRNNLP